MPLQEFDADEVAKLQAAYKAAAPSKTILDKLGANPKTRKQVLALLKEADPSLVIPEIDAAKPIYDEVESLKKALAEEKAARAKEKEDDENKKRERGAEESIAKGRKYLLESGVFEDKIPAIEEFMTKRGLIDYEAGLALWEKSQPAEGPSFPTDAFGRMSGLMQPEKGNPWAEVVTKPRMQALNLAKKVSYDQVREWFKENRGQSRRSA